MTAIAATGHRPSKLGLITETQLFQIAHQFLSENRPSRAISGMALGWDMAFAEAALSLHIPLTAAIPFPNQPSRWPLAQITRWKQIRQRADETVTIAPDYSAHAFQARNEYMVDNCDLLLALWNGTSGGTANCLRYARAKPEPRPQIINVWSRIPPQL